MYIAEHIKGIVKSAFFFCHGESAIRDVLVAEDPNPGTRTIVARVFLDFGISATRRGN